MRMSKDEVIEPEKFGNHFLHGDFVEIYNQCIQEFRELITVEDFIESAQSFNQGTESYQIDMQTSLSKFTQYIWLDSRKEKAISVSFDENNTIHSIYLKPYIKHPESDERDTQNSFIMPIKDEWFVFWGGKNEFLNYHYIYESQRYAYDLVVMKDNQTYQNHQLRNESYYAFGKEVVAPADGKIVKVVNIIMDNMPGEMNESQPAGNYIVIKHLHNEYSLLAHFKQSSIMVKEGEDVKQGQVIGLCGNSGNSSEPHIHFQVMDSPDINACKSICIRFTDEIEPIQGDTVTQGMLNNDADHRSLDNLDKAEIAFSLTDVLLIIPRLIGQLFK